jgi:prepilin-type N-terminal cleavage/methylation domain-containing protein
MRRNGFTLVELVVAMFLLVLGLLGVISGSVRITRSINSGDSYVNAATAAASGLELWRGTRCSGTAASPEAVGHGVVLLGQWPEDAIVQQASVTVAVNLWHTSRVDTFTVTGGC